MQKKVIKKEVPPEVSVLPAKEHSSPENLPIKTNAVISPARKKREYKPRTKLTFKQEMFAQRYIKNKGNGTKTALEVYNPKNERIGQALASENLSKPMVVNRITELMNENKLTLSHCVKKLHKQTEATKPLVIGSEVQFVPDNASINDALKTSFKLHGVLSDTNIAIDNRSLNLGLSEGELKGIEQMCGMLKDMNAKLSMGDVQDGEVIDIEGT